MAAVGISGHFTAEEIEALVITAAEAVCGQPADLSTRQADLAARAYKLLSEEQQPPHGLSPQQASLPREIWVLRHDDKHGDDVSLHATRAGALGALAQTVRSRWDNIIGEPGVPDIADLLDDQTAVEIYFRHRSGSETYSIYSEPVARANLESYDPADVIDGIEQQDTCGCGEPIVLYSGDWLHLYNPELTGADDHDASPS